MYRHGWTEETKTITPRKGATLNDLAWDPMGQMPKVADEGHRFRYRCNLCGKHGRWYRDGNMMVIMWESHNDREHA